MNWILDIIALLLIIGLTIYGFKAGFLHSLLDVALVLVAIGGAVFLAYLTVTKLYLKWGWLADLTNGFKSLLGDSKIEGGQEIVDKVAFYLAFGVLILITFIVYDIFLMLVRKLIYKLLTKVRDKLKFIKVLDCILGGLVAFVFTSGLILSLMALCNAFSETAFLSHLREAFLGSNILSYFYGINPLNSLFENLGLADALSNALSILG